MVVINHHGPATEWELGYMDGITQGLFPNRKLRKGQRKIPDEGPLAHIHWHIEIDKEAEK